LTLALAGVLLVAAGPRPAAAATIFDSGAAGGPDIGADNSDPFAVFDNFTLPAASIVNGMTWTQHESSARGYMGTDVSIFNAIPSPSSAVFSGTFLAERDPNGSPPLFGTLNGFNYALSGLNVSLAAGTYFIGIQTHFDNGAFSTWDETTRSGSSLRGRYQLVPLRNVAAGTNPPMFDSNDALIFYADQDSAFQLLGTTQASPTSDPTPVPEPGAIVIYSTLLVAFSCRWRGRSKQQDFGRG
jgi:hypothetical protein